MDTNDGAEVQASISCQTVKGTLKQEHLQNAVKQTQIKKLLFLKASILCSGCVCVTLTIALEGTSAHLLVHANEGVLRVWVHSACMESRVRVGSVKDEEEEEEEGR